MSEKKMERKLFGFVKKTTKHNSRVVDIIYRDTECNKFTLNNSLKRNKVEHTDICLRGSTVLISNIDKRSDKFDGLIQILCNVYHYKWIVNETISLSLSRSITFIHFSLPPFTFLFLSIFRFRLPVNSIFANNFFFCVLCRRNVNPATNTTNRFM